MMCENGSEFNDTVDPRVHIELERLNSATDEINKLELELDEARQSFRQLLCDSTAKVDALRAKLGMCVERSKPYYEARICSNEALKQTQVAAMKYERANSAHSAAREMVYLAEQGLGGRTLDPAWQEMLNHATQRVNDAERDRGVASGEHRIACLKHEAANAKVQSLQKELKRAIAKSRPYYEMKAHFNQLLEHQKLRVQNLETQVSTAKLTYSEALQNLEQISDEIHQNRRKASAVSSSLSSSKQRSIDSSESFLEDAQDLRDIEDEYKSLPQKLNTLASPVFMKLEDINGFKTVNLEASNGSPMSPSSQSEEKIENPSVAQSHSSEWTEINLENSSPEDDIPYKKLQDGVGVSKEKPKLSKQYTMPQTENEYSVLKNKIKLDTTISNWISRSSAKNDDSFLNQSRRQSLDNILGPTGEKVKEMFSHGMMMLNISSLTDRRNSEPRSANNLEERPKSFSKKIPSPLEKSMTYLTTEDENSDTESLSSVDMLNEEQIYSLMLDKEIEAVCEQVLGTPITEVVNFPRSASSSVITQK